LEAQVTTSSRSTDPEPVPQTFQEVLAGFDADPWGADDARRRITAESALGHTVTLLAQRGHRTTAELVLDVENVSLEYDQDTETWDLWLEVPPGQDLHFSSNHIDRLRDTCHEVCDRLGYSRFYIGVREILPNVGPDWRDQLRQSLNGKRPTNQGRRVRTEPPRFVEDRLYFTNQGEQTVYRALRHIQGQLPADETLTIYPLAGCRVPGHTWEPDFLVAYKGRAGVLEVDGPHHNGRRAMDTTRDHLLRNAGIAFVDRITVEVINDTAELDAVLRRFLKCLGQTP
jgi:hypothetical protein